MERFSGDQDAASILAAAEGAEINLKGHCLACRSRPRDKPELSAQLRGAADHMGLVLDPETGAT